MHLDQYQAIDPSVLLKTVGGDIGSFRRLSDTFLRIAPSTMRRLEEAVLAGKCAEAALESHTFKGTVALVGAIQLIKIIEDIEGLSRHGDLDGSAQLLPQLARDFSVVMQEVQTSILRVNGTDGLDVSAVLKASQ